jgi:UDP-glucose 4-epimerase
MTRMDGEELLVTGGSGFVGRAVVRALVARGCRVVVVDELRSPDPNIEMIVGDLRDPGVRDRAVRSSLGGIVHLAGATSVLRSMTEPLETFRDNVEVTAALLELARIRAIERFVFSSTNAVAGDVGDQVIDENVALRPLTAYGATKGAAEALLWGYAGSYDMATCALRFTNIYGAGMGHKDSFVARLMRAARSGAAVQIYGDGTQCRDLIYVDDVVAATLLAVRDRWLGPVVVGTGHSLTVLELVERVRRVTGAALVTEHAPPRHGEMPAVRVDIARARGLGFEPSIELDEGLARVWEDARMRWSDTAA